MRRLLLASMLVGLGACALPAAAAGQFFAIGGGSGAALVSSVETPLRATGSVTIDFHGDPAAGCEAAHLCGVSGAVTWTPDRTGALVTFGYLVEGQRYEEGLLALGIGPAGGGNTTSARVRRDASGDAADGICADGSREDFLLLGSAVRAGTSVTVSLTGAGGGIPTSDHFRTRCAGPTAADILTLLPTRVLTERQILRGRRRVDLSAERPFAAHGLAGTVRSTVALHLSKGQRTLMEDSEELPPGTRVQRHRRRAIDVSYAVESVSGQAVTDVRGLADPDLCGPLDACGLLGTLTIAPRASGGEAFLTAVGPFRTTARDLSRAVGLAPGGRPDGVRAGGFAFWEGDGGTVRSELTRSGEPACSDSEPVPGGSLDLRVSARSVRVLYGTAESSVADSLRTRCPGPGIDDVAGTHALASGTVPLSDFGARRVTLHLTRGGAFSGDGYEGSTGSDVTVVLRRKRVRRYVRVYFDFELIDVVRLSRRMLLREARG